MKQDPVTHPSYLEQLRLHVAQQQALGVALDKAVQIIGQEKVALALCESHVAEKI